MPTARVRLWSELLVLFCAERVESEVSTRTDAARARAAWPGIPLEIAEVISAGMRGRGGLSVPATDAGLLSFCRKYGETAPVGVSGAVSWPADGAAPALGCGTYMIEAAGDRLLSVRLIDADAFAETYLLPGLTGYVRRQR